MQLQTVWRPYIANWKNCSNASQSPVLCSDEWARESVKLACSNAYVDADGSTHIKSGFHLTEAYYQRQFPLIELQVAKAAVRLASVLNAALFIRQRT